MFKRLIIALFIFFSLADSLYAQSEEGAVAILIDVSGSMRFQGNWINDTRRTLKDLLLGGSLDESVWRVDGIGDSELINDLRVGMPLYNTGEYMLMLHFGQNYDNYPFFRKVDLQNFSDLNEAAHFIEMTFPTRFNDLWTFTTLAKVVARNELSLKGNVRKWYTIEITDADEDIPRFAVISPVIDSITAAYPTTVSEQAKISLSYRNDPRLKILISEVVNLAVPKPLEFSRTRIRLIAPRNAQQIETVSEEDTLRFQWRSVKDIIVYNVVIKPEARDYVIRFRPTSRTYVDYADELSEGKYTWSVEGILIDRTRVISPVMSFEVTGSTGGFIWVFLILFVSGGGFFLVMRRRRKHRRQRQRSLDEASTALDPLPYPQENSLQAPPTPTPETEKPEPILPVVEAPEPKIDPTRPLRVFLCHAREDKEAVRDLYKRLRAANIEPWLDEEDILPGQPWQQEIRKAIRSTDTVIVCLSHNAINKSGFVQKEIIYAFDFAEEQPEGTISLIPLRFEKCDVPEKFRSLQRVDLFDEKGFELLMRALQTRASELGINDLPGE